MTKRVAIIEDHPTTRAGLEAAIRDDSEYELAVSASSVEEFYLRKPRNVDVVILDLGLPGGDLQGAAAVASLVEREFLVLVLSMRARRGPVLDAMAAGAKGYLTKDAEVAEIGRAVRQVAMGRTYLSPTIAGYVLKDEVKLTGREREVLRLVAEGETAKTVAQLLNIAESTVNKHLDKIRDKTGARRRAEITAYAINEGYTAEPDE